MDGAGKIGYLHAWTLKHTPYEKKKSTQNRLKRFKPET